MIIRDIERGDLGQWRPLWAGYNAFYGRSGPTALPDAVTTATWDRFFDAYEPVHGLVAEADGRLVGIVHFLYHRSTTALGPLCYLQDLFTSEGSRGRGVGRALIEAVCRKAAAAGVERVYWHTQETNLTARRLYDKVADLPGFVMYRKTSV